MAVATKKKKIFDDRYEILTIIGRGSQSVVYQAKNVIEGGPEVALKVLAKKKSDIPNSERLRKEALAMVSCNHRYVVHLDDFHTIGDVSYLSMELAAEGDLRRFIGKKGGRLDASIIERFFAQTTEALDYIHKVGIIHRDVKPDNILILNEQEMRLGDFGIALLPGETPVTEDAQVGVGTMDYLSPEILQGKQFCVLSDLYSLGICFFEIITGKTPFADVPLMQQLEARRNDHIKALSSIRSDIPPYLTEIIIKMLQFNPAERFQNAGDILKALQAAKDGKPLASIPAAVQKAPILAPKPSQETAPAQSIAPAPSAPAAKAATVQVEQIPVKTPAPQAPAPGTQQFSKSAGQGASSQPITAQKSFKETEYEDAAEEDEEKGFLDEMERVEEQGRTGESQEERIMFRKSTTTSENQNHQRFRAGVPSEMKGDSSRRNAPEYNQPQKSGFFAKLFILGITIACAAGLWRYSMRSAEIQQEQTPGSKTGLVSTESFFDAITGRSFDFTRLKPGVYTGMIGGIVPGREVPLSLLVLENSRNATVLVGVEGWTPQTISLDSERVLEKPYALRVASNGFIIELLASGEVNSKLVKGEVDNIITGERASWLLTPQM